MNFSLQHLWEQVLAGERGAVSWILAGTFGLLVALRWLTAGIPFGEETTRRLPDIPQEISQGPGREPRIRVYLHESDEVRELPLEGYLLGVVAAEMETEWPLEALKAQAVIARTFTLQRIDERGTIAGRDAHASTDPEEFQAYDADQINDRVQEAVAQTRGQVLIFDGTYARTWFHAYSGGHTTTPEVGLGWDGSSLPYLRPVDDSELDEGIPEDVRRWELTLSRQSLRDTARAVTGEDPGPVTSVTLEDQSPDGRARTVRIGDVSVPAPDFRMAVGSTEFKSTLIDDITEVDEGFTFRGRGYGHGVGMSQWGARVMAERGQTFEDIIDRYYLEVEIARLWD